MKKSELTEGDWEVAKQRAETLSDDYGIGIVGRLLTKGELLKDIEIRGEIGELYVESQKEFLRWLVTSVKQRYEQ